MLSGTWRRKALCSLLSVKIGQQVYRRDATRAPVQHQLVDGGTDVSGCCWGHGGHCSCGCGLVVVQPPPQTCTRIFRRALLFHSVVVFFSFRLSLRGLFKAWLGVPAYVSLCRCVVVCLIDFPTVTPHQCRGDVL